MEVKYHGHACIEIITNAQKHILIDPFITGNKLSDLTVSEVKADFIILTHAHGDHVGDTVEIARNNQALVIAIDELANYLGNRYHLDTLGMNIGGKVKYDFGGVKFVSAQHTSSIEDNGQIIMLGAAAGLLLKVDGRMIYHAGDTGLFSDMQLLAHKKIDLAFLPIGDRYTMGVGDAAIAAKWIDAKTVVPIHYNTFPFIEQNPNDFVKALKNLHGTVLNAGEGLFF